MENACLCCTVCIEELSSTGNVVRKVQHRNLTLTIGRDEFKEMQLKITFPKKESKYLVKELLIHKKFVKDGKATVKLPDHKVQLMLSNCPPDKLMMFLKTLQTKLDCLKDKGFLSQRQKLFSGKHREFEEISPLTLKDLQTAHNAKVKATQKSKLAMPSKPSSSSSSLSTASIAGKKRTSDQGGHLSSLSQKENGDKRQKVSPGVPKFMTMSKINGISPSKVLAKSVMLTPEQNQVLEMVKKGRSIFFTGSAGTGKSFLLKRIIGALPPNHTFATASTGVAACHIGGTTLHSFAGIGSGKAPLQQCIELASRQRVAQQWRACKHLIIDEVSMVDGELFDKLENVARVIRKSDQPFGGIQLILCGDFLQLPPVTRPGEIRRFCFQSEAWQKCLETTMQLTDVKRQADKSFINILQYVRKGMCPDFVSDTLQATKHHIIEKDGVVATRLCTHKVDVEEINVSSLKELQGESRKFAATDSEEGYALHLNTLCPVPASLELKIGAQVMLCKNLDVQRGLVNGARGVVTSYDTKNHGHPVVKFVCGVTEIIKPSRWVFRLSGGNTVVRRQVPLKLAWAISIHKSQGMTLDCVEMSLSRVFETGQAYVALSRAKSLEGLRVLDFSNSCVRADPRVLSFYNRLDLRHRMMHNGIEDENEIFRPNPSAMAKR
ncbi:ATP-dependent DNA helicase PIF1 [Aplysia californica]|uniref:ATP-dependent DNA helicase PIF1 n=1 Tax=Aplysia californica TaxID=6500 RepID=A0ABM0JQN1_APLCA|nr:ATP-dependent DNA helicase PIF1 [Aplysia californica]